MLRYNDQLGVQFDDADTRDETKRQVLWAMRRSLTEIGWCQSSWAQTDGPPRVFDVEPAGGSACRFCLGGALAFTLNDNNATAPKHGLDWKARPSRLALDVREALGSCIYTRSGLAPMYSPSLMTDAIDVMVEWNDRAQRTIADVVDLLDYAIEHIPVPDLVPDVPTPGA